MPDPATVDREQARAIVGQCAYGRPCAPNGPRCVRCSKTDEIAQAIAAARLEGVRAGLEKAAAVVHGMPPGVPTGGDDYDDWTLEDVEQRILAIDPAACLKEQ